MKKKLFWGVPLLALAILVGWRFSAEAKAEGEQKAQQSRRRGMAPASRGGGGAAEFGIRIGIFSRDLALPVERAGGRSSAVLLGLAIDQQAPLLGAGCVKTLCRNGSQQFC